MKLLIDTQVAVWLLSGDRRLEPAWIERFRDPDTSLHLSAVVAWEYSDLRRRGRLPVQEDVADLQALYGLELIDFTAECWTLANELPDIHRDPVDRMLVAHAIAEDMVLVTADANIRRYPVKTL